MRIYLAGPMRGLPEFNFPAFDKGARHLEAMGHEVFNPADRDRSVGFSTKGMTGHEDLAAEGFSLREALHADTEWISLHADAIALLPGWEKSSGVAAEVALARALGLPVVLTEDFISHARQIGDGSRGIPDSILIKTDVKPSGTIQRPGKLVSSDELRASLGLPLRPDASLADHLESHANRKEVRTTSSTGGEKGTKPERHDLIPVEALGQVAALYGRGAEKYAAHNWRRGYEWSKSYAALQRHATQFWAGEDNDAEMGLPHMASVAFHALALLTFMDEQRSFDDRYKA